MKTIAPTSLMLVAALISILLPWESGGAAEPIRSHGEPRRSTQIQYINPIVPAIQIPEYPGERYHARVPDTLDLGERAALGVHGLTGPLDPDADYELYFLAVFTNNPPYLVHDFNDHVQHKFHESLPLMRLASGSDLNEVVDQRWMEITLQMQGPDGLLYQPVIGRPWCKKGVIGTLAEDQTQFTEPYYNGRMLAALALYYRLTGDERWLAAGRRIVDGLTGQAIEKDDYAYFSKWVYGVNEKASPNDAMPDDWCRMGYAWVSMGLTQFYRVSDYEPALDLSGKLVRCLRFHSELFDPDGKFVGIGMHFHGHLYVLLSMMEYAEATNDWELTQFVRKGFEFGIANMWPVIGYVPEQISDKEWRGSEICGVADIIALALKLTRAGAGDYWDDVDRWTRNQLAECQLTDADWVENMVRDKPLALDVEILGSKYNLADDSATFHDHATECCLGGFAGWPSVNDFQGKADGPTFMHCCTGNGTRSLYYVWKDILAYNHDSLKVNLLMNRAAFWADVDSFVPYEGKVQVRIKQPLALSIRIPEWVKPSEAVCMVNQENRTLSWDGRYAVVGRVQPGDTVTLDFPINEREDTLSIYGTNYTITRRGNDVVHIDPPGNRGPLYQRDRYRTGQVQWHEVERFVPTEELAW